MLMAAVYGVGTIGYWTLGAIYLEPPDAWSALDCFYMTVISVTTVGYGEYLDVHLVPGGAQFTVFIILLGSVAEIYMAAILTTFLVEGHLFNIRQLYRMRKRLESMRDHVVLCGAGRSGYHVAAELAETGHDFVVVDTSDERLEQVLGLQSNDSGEIAVVEGDATERDVLQRAGIERARILIVSLPDDKAILYTVMLARQCNASMHIVAKSADPKTISLLERAGADRVVATKSVSGLRLASEAIRPNVVDFLAKMITDEEDVVRFEEIVIGEDARLANARLSDFSDAMDRPNLCVVAVQRDKERGYYYGPPPEFELHSGDTLVVVGDRDAIARLRELGE